MFCTQNQNPTPSQDNRVLFNTSVWADPAQSSLSVCHNQWPFPGTLCICAVCQLVTRVGKLRRNLDCSRSRDTQACTYLWKSCLLMANFGGFKWACILLQAPLAVAQDLPSWWFGGKCTSSCCEQPLSAWGQYCPIIPCSQQATMSLAVDILANQCSHSTMHVTFLWPWPISWPHLFCIFST